MPEPVEGDFAGDGDVGGVNELGDVWSDGGESDDGALELVDDEARASGVAVGVERRSGDGTEVVFNGADCKPAACAAAAVSQGRVVFRRVTLICRG